MDRGAWRATVHGAAKNRTGLKRLSSSSNTIRSTLAGDEKEFSQRSKTSSCHSCTQSPSDGHTTLWRFTQSCANLQRHTCPAVPTLGRCHASARRSDCTVVLTVTNMCTESSPSPRISQGHSNTSHLAVTLAPGEAHTQLCQHSEGHRLNRSHTR